EKHAAQETSGAFLFGDSPTVAEIALVPQIYNARRYEMDLTAYPALLAVEKKCLELEAFQKARPSIPSA
uniref:glutathione S-transferase C-terminal domain-containing protein n=3 Tax=Hyphomonadaceae TaxID=69657 RepID=UPI003510F61F